MPHMPPAFRLPQTATAFAAPQRENSYRRGYATKRWIAYTKRFKLEHPFCDECGEPTQHVDHDQRVSGPDDPLFWDPSNHRPKCHKCHSRKTAKYDGGFGNRKRRRN